MLEELSLEQILSRTEMLDNTKEYRFNEQEGIGGKPSIVAGSESLKRFPLKIKLHASFCNPKKVIEEIEKRAGNRETINYFQSGEYIGDYVIEKFNTNILQTYNKAVVYAEIGIDLLENPDSITEYEQQTKTTPTITTASVSSSSTKMKNFITTAKNMIVANVFENAVSMVQNGEIANLSNAGTILLNSLQSSIVSEIEPAGLTQATPIVAKYTATLTPSITLDATQCNILKAELNKIPEKLINSALRKS